MTEMTGVEVETQGAIATVRFDRGGKANALDYAMIDSLEAAATELSRNPDVSVVVLAGTPSIFAAGVDLKDARLWNPEGGDVARHLSMNAGVRMSNAWRRLPQIVIAALEGPAIGGGAILALCADFRVVSEEAYLRFPEVRLGMTLGWGGLPLLTERVGAGRAKRILCCDETIGADEALALGLADRKVPAGTAFEAARSWAASIAESPAMSLRMTKSAIDAHARRNWAEGAEGDQFLLAKLLAESGSTG
ncbi:enoyl-CoA hydratase [Salipiger pallidus]|uniref:Enoyl-CoA hydratase n=1 Tax=Salipiger pallidus TaxID=1775170 RepID=A0A8J2ZN50_9RHOB|nr:enoyl-CoA hydratase/isomerase family protein [Salipiger pallidus]GGG83805.1 enoyl-CoA hydratase [Salipiger pallidus]